MQTSIVSVTDEVSTQPAQRDRSVTDFVEWLKSRPTDTQFGEGLRLDTCPVAVFLGRRASYSDDSLPVWARTFMMRFDSEESTSLQDALKIANEIQGEQACGRS